LTAALGSVLLVLVGVVVVTGFLSHLAYEYGLPGNRIVPNDLPLNVGWPAGPAWLYAVSQGLHVHVGLAAIPFVLAKLWSVIPRLFAWPPVVSPAQAIERLSIALLVASAVFQFVTGTMNMQYWYAFPFGFVVAHYYGAVVFTGALVLHVLVKAPTVVGAYRRRGWLRPLRDDVHATRAEPVEGPDSLVAAEPAAATISRRGLFAFAGGASLLLLTASAGQSIGGPVRKRAFLAPRREDFPVNKTAATAGITPQMTGASWRLTVRAGSTERVLDRDALLALPQHTAGLPIACVEGWTTWQQWTGVRLSELAALVGASAPDSAFVQSLQQNSILARTSLSGDTVAHPDALLALAVNDADLSPDHGYPARIIAPAIPGVHNTKWVASIDFQSA
jgi:DMSO/TMAO reductase YedYZ molybdopterin-dependent catalytic subunit